MRRLYCLIHFKSVAHRTRADSCSSPSYHMARSHLAAGIWVMDSLYTQTSRVLPVRKQSLTKPLEFDV